MQRNRGTVLPSGLTDMIRPIGMIALFLLMMLALVFGIRGCVRGEDAVDALAQGGKGEAASEGGAQNAEDDGASWDEESLDESGADPNVAPTKEPKPTKQLTTLTPDELADVKLLPVINRNKDVKGKMVAITVDDCFQTETLKKILKLAEKHGAKLTFYPKGKEVEKNAALWKQIYEHGGYQIGNHTFSHGNVTDKPDDELREEITKANDAINQAIGMNYHMTSFRCPTGDGNKDPRLHKILRELGYENVAMWGLSGNRKATETLKMMQKGVIILFHSRPTDYERLKVIIPDLKKKGYKMVTVNELYGKPADSITPLDG